MNSIFEKWKNLDENKNKTILDFKQENLKDYNLFVQEQTEALLDARDQQSFEDFCETLKDHKKQIIENNLNEATINKIPIIDYERLYFDALHREISRKLRFVTSNAKTFTIVAKEVFQGSGNNGIAPKYFEDNPYIDTAKTREKEAIAFFKNIMSENPPDAFVGSQEGKLKFKTFRNQLKTTVANAYRAAYKSSSQKASSNREEIASFPEIATNLLKRSHLITDGDGARNIGLNVSARVRRPESQDQSAWKEQYIFIIEKAQSQGMLNSHESQAIIKKINNTPIDYHMIDPAEGIPEFNKLIEKSLHFSQTQYKGLSNLPTFYNKHFKRFIDIEAAISDNDEQSKKIKSFLENQDIKARQSVVPAFKNLMSKEDKTLISRYQEIAKVIRNETGYQVNFERDDANHCIRMYVYNPLSLYLDRKSISDFPFFRIEYEHDFMIGNKRSASMFLDFTDDGHAAIKTMPEVQADDLYNYVKGSSFKKALKEGRLHDVENRFLDIISNSYKLATTAINHTSQGEGISSSFAGAKNRNANLAFTLKGDRFLSRLIYAEKQKTPMDEYEQNSIKTDLMTIYQTYLQHGIEKDLANKWLINYEKDSKYAYIVKNHPQLWKSFQGYITELRNSGLQLTGGSVGENALSNLQSGVTEQANLVPGQEGRAYLKRDQGSDQARRQQESTIYKSSRLVSAAGKAMGLDAAKVTNVLGVSDKQVWEAAREIGMSAAEASRYSINEGQMMGDEALSEALSSSVREVQWQLSAQDYNARVEQIKKQKVNKEFNEIIRTKEFQEKVQREILKVSGFHFLEDVPKDVFKSVKKDCYTQLRLELFAKIGVTPDEVFVRELKDNRPTSKPGKLLNYTFDEETQKHIFIGEDAFSRGIGDKVISQVDSIRSILIDLPDKLKRQVIYNTYRDAYGISHDTVLDSVIKGELDKLADSIHAFQEKGSVLDTRKWSDTYSRNLHALFSNCPDPIAAITKVTTKGALQKEIKDLILDNIKESADGVFLYSGVVDKIKNNFSITKDDEALGNTNLNEKKSQAMLALLYILDQALLQAKIIHAPQWKMEIDKNGMATSFTHLYTMGSSDISISNQYYAYGENVEEGSIAMGSAKGSAKNTIQLNANRVNKMALDSKSGNFISVNETERIINQTIEAIEKHEGITIEELNKLQQLADKAKANTLYSHGKGISTQYSADDLSENNPYRPISIGYGENFVIDLNKVDLREALDHGNFSASLRGLVQAEKNKRKEQFQKIEEERAKNDPQYKKQVFDPTLIDIFIETGGFQSSARFGKIITGNRVFLNSAFGQDYGEFFTEDIRELAMALRPDKEGKINSERVREAALNLYGRQQNDVRNKAKGTTFSKANRAKTKNTVSLEITGVNVNAILSNKERTEAFEGENSNDDKIKNESRVSAFYSIMNEGGLFIAASIGRKIFKNLSGGVIDALFEEICTGMSDSEKSQIKDKKEFVIRSLTEGTEEFNNYIKRRGSAATGLIGIVFRPPSIDGGDPQQISRIFFAPDKTVGGCDMRIGLGLAKRVNGDHDGDHVGVMFEHLTDQALRGGWHRMSKQSEMEFRNEAYSNVFATDDAGNEAQKDAAPETLTGEKLKFYNANADAISSVLSKVNKFYVGQIHNISQQLGLSLGDVRIADPNSPDFYKLNRDQLVKMMCLAMLSSPEQDMISAKKNIETIDKLLPQGLNSQEDIDKLYEALNYVPNYVYTFKGKGGASMTPEELKERFKNMGLMDEDENIKLREGLINAFSPDEKKSVEALGEAFTFDMLMTALKSNTDSLVKVLSEANRTQEEAKDQSNPYVSGQKVSAAINNLMSGDKNIDSLIETMRLLIEAIGGGGGNPGILSPITTIANSLQGGGMPYQFGVSGTQLAKISNPFSSEKESAQEYYFNKLFIRKDGQASLREKIRAAELDEESGTVKFVKLNEKGEAINEAGIAIRDANGNLIEGVEGTTVDDTSIGNKGALVGGGYENSNLATNAALFGYRPDQIEEFKRERAAMTATTQGTYGHSYSEFILNANKLLENKEENNDVNQLLESLEKVAKDTTNAKKAEEAQTILKRLKDTEEYTKKLYLTLGYNATDLETAQVIARNVGVQSAHDAFLDSGGNYQNIHSEQQLTTNYKGQHITSEADTISTKTIQNDQGRNITETIIGDTKTHSGKPHGSEIAQLIIEAYEMNEMLNEIQQAGDEGTSGRQKKAEEIENKLRKAAEAKGTTSSYTAEQLSSMAGTGEIKDENGNIIESRSHRVKARFTLFNNETGESFRRTFDYNNVSKELIDAVLSGSQEATEQILQSLLNAPEVATPNKLGPIKGYVEQLKKFVENGTMSYAGARPEDTRTIEEQLKANGEEYNKLLKERLELQKEIAKINKTLRDSALDDDQKGFFETDKTAMKTRLREVEKKLNEDFNQDNPKKKISEADRLQGKITEAKYFEEISREGISDRDYYLGKYGKSVDSLNSLETQYYQNRHNRNLTTNEREISALDSLAESLAKQIIEARKKVENAQRDIDEYNESKDKVDTIDTTDLAKQKEAEKQLKILGIDTRDRGSKNIFDKTKSDLQMAFSRYFDFNIVTRGISKLSNAIRKVITLTKELDKSATNIRVVTGQNAEQTQNLMKTYSDMATKLGTTTVEISKASNEWMRQGYTVEATEKLIKASTYSATLGMTDQSTATKNLTSMLKGFKLEAEDAMGIVDKLSALDMKYAASQSQIAEALSRTSSVAQQAGMNLEETAAAVTVMMDVSQQGAEVAGTAMKSMISRFGSINASSFAKEEGEDTEGVNDIERVLSSVGIQIRSSTTDMRSYSDVLGDVADKWSTLNDIQKNAIATAMAGTRQRNQFTILVENWDEVKEAEETALNANGVAETKYDAYTESITYSVQQLTAAWEELSLKIQSNDLIKGITRFATFTTKNLDWILDSFLKMFAAFNSWKMPNTFKRIFTGAGINPDGTKKPNLFSRINSHFSGIKEKGFKTWYTDKQQEYAKRGEEYHKKDFLQNLLGVTKRIADNTDPKNKQGAQPEGAQPEGAQPEGAQPEGAQPEGSVVAQRALAGLGAGVVSGISTFTTGSTGVVGQVGQKLGLNKFEELGLSKSTEDKAVMGLISGATTAALTAALPGIGPILGPMLGDLFNTLYLNFAHKEDIEMKERVNEAKDNLEALAKFSDSIENAITNSMKDRSAFTSEDWKELGEIAKSYNQMMASEIGEEMRSALKAVGMDDDTIDDLGGTLQNATLTTDAEEITSKVAAAEALVQAQQTYAQGEEERSTLRKQLADARKDLAKASANYEKYKETDTAKADKALDEMREATSAIEMYSASLDNFVNELQEGQLTAAYYQTISTMSEADLKGYALETLIQKVAVAAKKLGYYGAVDSNGNISSSVRNDIVQILREQGTTEKIASSVLTYSTINKMQGWIKNKDITAERANDADSALSDEDRNAFFNYNPEKLKTIASAFSLTTDSFDKLGTIANIVTESDASQGFDKWIEKLGKLSDIISNGVSGLSNEQMKTLVTQFPGAFFDNNDDGKFDVSNVMSNIAQWYSSGELTQLAFGSFLNEALTDSDYFSLFAKSRGIKNPSQLNSKTYSQMVATGKFEGLEGIENAEQLREKFTEFMAELFRESETEKQVRTEALKVITNQYDVEINRLTEIKDSLSDVNEQREKELKLIEAKQKLENAQKEKKRTYIQGVGWTYVADQEAIKSAQEELENLQIEQEQGDLQYQIDQLTKEKEIIENFDENKTLKELKDSFDDTFTDETSEFAKAMKYLAGQLPNEEDAMDGLEDVEKQNAQKALDDLYSAKSSLQTAYDAIWDSEGKLQPQDQITLRRNLAAYEAANTAYTDAKNAAGKYSSLTAENSIFESTTGGKTYSDITSGDTEEGSIFNKNTDEAKEKANKEFTSEIKIYSSARDRQNNTELPEGVIYFDTGKGQILYGAPNSTGEIVSDLDNNPIFQTDTASTIWYGEINGNEIKWTHSGESDVNWTVNSALATAQGASVGSVFYAYRNGKNYMIFKDGDNGWKKMTGVSITDVASSYGRNFETSSTPGVLPKNASGTLSSPGGTTLLNELGTEAIITPQGTITALPSKTGVVPADITKNLWSLGEIAPTLVKRATDAATLEKTLLNSDSHAIDIGTLNASFEAKEGFNFDDFMISVRQAIANNRHN